MKRSFFSEYENLPIQIDISHFSTDQNPIDVIVD